MLERIELCGDLAELDRVSPWVEALALRYQLPQQTVFAINLCLEEAISNIIRHGYKSDARQIIAISLQCIANELQFTIEDQAPHFEPKDAPIPSPQSLEELTPGGLGIPLMRHFATRVEWKPLPAGNRLTLTFALNQN